MYIYIYIYMCVCVCVYSYLDGQAFRCVNNIRVNDHEYGLYTVTLTMATFTFMLIVCTNVVMYAQIPNPQYFIE